MVYHHNPMSNQKVSMLRFQYYGFNVILYRAYVEHLCSFSFSHPNNIQFITYDCVGKAFVELLCSFFLLTPKIIFNSKISSKSLPVLIILRSNCSNGHFLMDEEVLSSHFMLYPERFLRIRI